MKVSEAKVAWITPVLGVDGKLLYWGRLLKAFAERCGEFCVFTAQYAGETSFVGFKIERSGFYKLAYKNERFTTQGHSNYIAGFSIIGPGVITKLKNYKPDLVILNEFGLQSLYGLLFAKFVCRNAKAKVLLIMEAKPRFLGGRWLTYAKVLFRRLLAKSADAVLTNNQEGRQYLTEVLGVPRNLIFSKPYLISDLPALAARQACEADRHLKPRDTRQVRFLYVGQLLQRKGIQYALEACAKLLPKYAGRFIYEIVGDGPYRPELEARARSLGVDRHVVFRGRQSYEMLGRFYAEADVFLFPTLADYRSLVPFEAMSLGLPILASVHDGGIVETVSQGENGFRFDPYDVQKLAELMARFIEDPDLISAYSKKSLEKANTYTLSNAIDALVQACEMALEGPDRQVNQSYSSHE